MIFFSFFKTLVGKEVAVELKNDIVMTGTLVSVDQYLNVKLKNVSVINAESHPQLAALKNCFIRGSTVRYLLHGVVYNSDPYYANVFTHTHVVSFVLYVPHDMMQ